MGRVFLFGRKLRADVGIGPYYGATIGRPPKGNKKRANTVRPYEAVKITP